MDDGQPDDRAAARGRRGRARLNASCDSPNQSKATPRDCLISDREPGARRGIGPFAQGLRTQCTDLTLPSACWRCAGTGHHPTWKSRTPTEQVQRPVGRVAPARSSQKQMEAYLV